MIVIMICLFSLSALLFLLWLFYKGQETKVEKEIEQLSLEHVQEMYIIKNEFVHLKRKSCTRNRYQRYLF